MKLPTALSERDRRALNTLVVAACLFLLARFVAFPLWDATSGGSVAIPVREKTLRKYRALAEATAGRENDFSTIKERLAEAEAGLLTGRTVPLAGAEAQQLLREMAAGVGIQVRSVDFLPPRKLGTEYTAVPLSAQFTASFDQLVGLLNNLHGAQKTLVVEQLRISTANDPTKKVNVYVVLSGVGAAELLKAESGN